MGLGAASAGACGMILAGVGLVERFGSFARAGGLTGPAAGVAFLGVRTVFFSIGR
jgi:hypothetical protein